MSFVFPWRASAAVRTQIHSYLERVDASMSHFEKAMQAVLGGRADEVEAIRAESHAAESAADDLRREIEQMLYEHELLPESRGDLLLLLESVDHIPGAAQGVLNILMLEKPQLPEFLHPLLRELTETNVHAYRLIRKAVESLMEDPRRTRELCVEVDREESRSDRIQMLALQHLFSSDLNLACKLQLKDVVRMLGAISDRCEHTADLLNIIAIKRRI